VIDNTTELIVSYLRINNKISQKYNISKYQQALSLNLHMLKQTIDEGNIIKLLQNVQYNLETGKYLEIRGKDLDIWIDKILSNINNVEYNLKEYLLEGNVFSIIYNFLFNDMFGSLNQLKIELVSRFNCEEVKITTFDNLKLDGYILLKIDS
jgi:hypothetical protein